jgi:response regulator RpfG family c-di-GMP phosphodiesterase
VLEASNGQEALQVAGNYASNIHLLVTDVIMPQMNGKDLADQITTLRPQTKTLFTSGYTDDAIVQHGVLKPGIAFLPKPFSPTALSQKVRATLDISS